MKAAKRWSLGNLRDMASSLPGPRHRAPSPSRRRARVYIIMALSLIAFFAVIAYMYPHHSKRACYMISSRGCKALADWLPPSLREYSDDEIAARVVISEILSNPPVIRKDSKIAFMFLTPGFDEMKAAKRWSLGNLRDMASSLPGPRHRAPSIYTFHLLSRV
ncbi:hypothetical protein F2Q70_00013643 [Brassica cretica]|uniref:Uncharacterized protein n=1 Tax=Brassica cretica TaxID=69181 RepID=A0A8S9LWY8_BRACR|nr:hypothetical protein F2Q70_00013643 [Brassica cretica]